MTIHRLMAGAAASALLAGAAQAEISDNAVRIGVLNDQSGLYADLAGQGSVEAARMAVEDFGGELDGNPIEILSADHQNKPDVGSNIVREWIDTQGVDVIVDVPTSSVALAVQEITRDKDTAFLINGAGSTRLTGEDCSPTSVHYAYDTYALAVGTGRAVVQDGGSSWFFITADYAFGHSLQEDTAAVVKENGGEVVGSVQHPLSSADFSSYLLQAQGSGAEVIGLANAGSDTTNAIKQANEFGIVQGGQKLAALLMFITDVHALGLDVSEGLQLTTGFYWDRDDESREFAQRFAERNNGRMPTMVHAGVYSSVMHYLNAVQRVGDDGGEAAISAMKEEPVNDFFARDGRIREDGRFVHDMYLAQVKAPGDSEGEWDLYNIVQRIPGEEAYRPMEEGACPFVSD